MSTTIDVYKDWLGIPEGERPPDHYQLLRLVPFEDDVEKIRKHYKKLNAHVRKYASGQYSVQSQELLNELAKAMLCLTDRERKLEYDRSLGREVEEPETGGQKPMEKILQEQGILSAGQVAEAKSFADKTGLSMRDALVQMKLVEPDVAARALAQELGRPYVDLTETFPDDTVLDKVPRSLVKRHTCLPLLIDNDTVLVACADEPDHELEDQIRLRYDMPLRAAIATPLAINQGIAKYYAPGMREEVADDGKAATKAAKKTAAKTSAAPKPKAKKSREPLSEGEKAQQKQIGIILICWAVIGFALLDTLVLKRFLGFMNTFPFLTLILVAPVVVFLIYKNYLKGN